MVKDVKKHKGHYKVTGSLKNREKYLIFDSMEESTGLEVRPRHLHKVLFVFVLVEGIS